MAGEDQGGESTDDLEAAFFATDKKAAAEGATAGGAVGGGADDDGGPGAHAASANGEGDEGPDGPGIDVSFDETRPHVPSDAGPAPASAEGATPARLPPATPLAAPLPFAPPPPDPRKEEPPSPEDAAAWTRRIEDLLREAKAHKGTPAAAPLWFEAGRIYENELKNLPQAAAHYQEANIADPLFLPVIHAARRLFAQLRKWKMVVALLDEELKIPGAPVAALIVEKGRIHETKLGKTDDAIALYREALKAEPGHAPAVDALVRHLASRGSQDELGQVLEGAALGATDDRQKLAYLLELARHYEARVDDPEAAILTFEKARALAPDNGEVLNALRRLYTRTQNVEALAEVLDAGVRMARSGGEGVQLAIQRARILERKGDLEGAVVALERARERNPADTLVLTELARLFERLERWPQLAATYVGLVDATQDKSERVALHAEAGVLAEEKLKDLDRAVAHYRACILTDPTYQPAIAALGRLFARRKMWRELNEIYEVQLRAAPDEQSRIPLLFKQSEMLADELGDVDVAIDKLLEILKINPAYVPALKLVSGLYLRQGRWGDLIAMYEAELEGQQDKDQAIFLLEKIGSIAEGQLGDMDQAIRAYKRMLDWIPGYLPALRSLGRLYARTERWDDLIGINTEESQIVGDQNHVVSLLFRNGDIYADKLGDVDRAIDSFQKALTLMPNYLPALKALGSIFARAGRWDDLIRMHRQEAEVSRQPEQRAHLLFTVAQIYAERLGDKARAAKVYNEILDERPGYHPAIRELARIAEATGDWAAVAEVYEKEIGVLSDPRDKAVWRVRVADILDRRLGRTADAVEALERAVAEASSLLVAHESLIAILSRLQDAKGEARARERLQEVLPDPASRLGNLRALAELYLYSLGDPDRALATLKAILDLRADDLEARRAAVTCALQMKDYGAAIQHAEVLATLEPNAEDVANLHLQIADWKEGHLDPPQDPLSNYLKVLEYAPHDPVALRAVERAYIQRHSWEGLYQLYERERQGTQVPLLVADLSMKMGELAERRLGQPDLACQAYEAALNARPDHLPAIMRLKDLYGDSGTPEQQLRMLAFEAQASRDPERAIQTLLEVGELQREKFNNIDAAVQSYFQVLQRDPHHDKAFAALEQMLGEGGRYDGLVELYLGRAKAAQDPAHQVESWMHAASLLEDKLHAPDRAVDVYAQVLAVSPVHAEALQRVGNIRFARGQWDDAVAAFEKLVSLGGDPAAQAAANKRLGVIFTDHRADPARAIRCLSACLQVTPDDVEARQRLAVAYAQAGQAAEAVQVHQQLLAQAATPEEQLAGRLALAQLYEGPLGDVAQAAATLMGALDSVQGPTERAELLQRTAALYERAQDLDGYLQAASRQADELARSDPRRAAEVLLRNARLVHDHKGDIDGAIDIARRGLEVDPDQLELRGVLADLYTVAPNQSMRAVEEHRRILWAGRVRVPSIKALYRAWSSQRAHDRAFVAAELLVFLKQASEDEDLFYGENRSRVAKESDEQLSLDELTSWIVHPDERNVVHEILSIVATELGKVDPDDLSVYEVDKRDMLNKRSDDTLRTLADSVVRNLGGLPFEVWRTRKKPHVVEAHNAQPLVLVVGSEVARAHPDREKRFLIGRKLMALRCGHPLIAGMDATRLAGFLSAIGRAVDKTFKPLVDRPDLDTLAKRIGGALPRGVRKMLAEPVALLGDLGPRLDLDAFLTATKMTQARAGLALSNDLAAAFQLVSRDSGGSLQVDAAALLAAIERDPVAADLVAFALSDEFFTVRQKLRFAIDA